MKKCQRKMTLEELARYEKSAAKYAEQLYAGCGVSATYGAEDAHDICVNAFLAKKQPWQKAKDEIHREALILTRLKSRIKNTLRHRLNRTEQVMTRAISVDEAPHGTFDEDGNEENIETTLISDEGRYAELTRNYEDPTPEPAYIKMTREEERKIYANTRDLKSRRVCRALKKTLTHSAAREISRVSKRDFCDILKNFQTRFTPSFRAWREEVQHFSCSKFQNFRG